MKKCHNDNNDHAKTIAIPRIFFENSRPKRDIILFNFYQKQMTIHVISFKITWDQQKMITCFKETETNKHSESIAWQYQVPYWLYVFLEV